MNSNQSIVEKFYTAFSRLDHVTMNSCYSDDVVFNDPVFGLLEGDRARGMWEMLCSNAKDFSLVFSDIQVLDEEYTTCRWTASYTFSATGRKVTNDIKAYMRFRDGLIAEHSDAFRLSKWISQALGWKGLIFGWTGFMKRAVRKKARRNLDKFMAARTAAPGSR